MLRKKPFQKLIDLEISQFSSIIIIRRYGDTAIRQYDDMTIRCIGWVFVSYYAMTKLLVAPVRENVLPISVSIGGIYYASFSVNSGITK